MNYSEYAVVFTNLIIENIRNGNSDFSNFPMTTADDGKYFSAFLEEAEKNDLVQLRQYMGGCYVKPTARFLRQNNL